MSDNDESTARDEIDLEEKGDEPTVDEDQTKDQADDGDSESDSENGSEGKKKKKTGLAFKILIVVGIVVVVLAGGGGGAYALFHDEPAFCNIVCHTPMDPYVESYESGTSINPQQTELEAPLSVTLHKDSDQQLNCLSCHVPSMSEQIEEGMKWVSGNYELPIEMKIVSGQIKEDSGDKNGVEFCLREGCHEGITTIEDLKKLTDDQARNPHDSHLDPGNSIQDCNKCHQTHEQSYMMCSQCHGDAKVPEGWLNYNEQQAQKKAAGQ
jgi:flagellar basal body-associated protein FliL